MTAIYTVSGSTANQLEQDARFIETELGLRSRDDIWLSYPEGLQASTLLRHLLTTEREVRRAAALLARGPGDLGSVELPGPFSASSVNIAEVRPGSVEFRFKQDSNGAWEREVKVKLPAVVILVAAALGWTVVAGDVVQPVGRLIKREVVELVVEFTQDIPGLVEPVVRVEP